jgi:hypothetical protein
MTPPPHRVDQLVTSSPVSLIAVPLIIRKEPLLNVEDEIDRGRRRRPLPERCHVFEGQITDEHDEFRPQPRRDAPHFSQVERLKLVEKLICSCDKRGQASPAALITREAIDRDPDFLAS